MLEADGGFDGTALLCKRNYIKGGSCSSHLTKNYLNPTFLSLIWGVFTDLGCFPFTRGRKIS